ncbi:MAG: hypothetical protein IT281_10395, partial [Ignavibacteria bacterium]|nr:hypothetical protein [Ignavibacteria bacterium]
MTVDEYVYEIINNKNDARLCAELIAEEFSAHNPLTMFEKQTPVDFFKECSWPLTAELFDERLSFLARYRSSGEIVGAVIAGDLYRYHHRHSYDASCPPNANPIFDLLDEMDNVFITKD